MVYFQSKLYVHPIQNKSDVYFQVFVFLLILNTHFGVLVHVRSALESPVINKVLTHRYAALFYTNNQNHMS